MKSSDASTGRQADHPTHSKDFLVVGIGASSGGIQALKIFFENVPADSGMAYVVILHLSPDHDSQLAQVLQVAAAIPVKQVVQTERIQPDQVYVVSPNHHLTMEDGHITVSPNLHLEDRRAPVDIFFRTLAESHGTNAVCVVLSGTGANGSMGLKRVKERGGTTFVQNPREAEFNEMPRNAIATELVDEVLPVAKIPGKIIAYRNSMGTVFIPAEAEKRPEEQQQALREIFAQLRLRTGNDFSNYKRPTLLRRLERRINIRNLPDLPAYATFLQDHPEEAAALLKDLLISVTNFFRDKRAWETMEQEVLPLLLKSKPAGSILRIWVAGCATGEEAYSIAMLCAEKTLGVLDAPKIQIFATDIDEAAISHAREGLYSLNDAADVSPDRLRRFFNKEGDHYRIRREVREMVMFALHNFIKDPPFSHLDLVTCRNVLIYLNHIAQERVAEIFHFALDPGGFLFLGSSETVDSATDLYASFNREHHIFQSRQVQARSYPVPDAVPTFTFATEQQKLQVPQADTGKRNSERVSFSDLHQRLLEEYAPPSLIADEEYNAIHISEQAGRYLQIGGGELSQNLLKLVRPELRLELRSALFQAMEQRLPIKSRPLPLTIGDRMETISLHVRPVLRPGDAANGYVLVLFEPVLEGAPPQEVMFTSDEPATRHLEEELMRMKAQLRATIEKYEFQGEELKASNEELQAMNEELRSAAEELETNKEELQSINEELRTVNQELKVKIEETSLSSNNLQNLIISTDIGTVFLDRSLRIRMFTPAISRIFNLIPADYGRPLSDITSKLMQTDIEQDAENVLKKLQTIEREVRTTDRQVFLMQVLPYRTAEDRIDGIVITFIDITKRKQAEEELRRSEARLQKTMKIGTVGVLFFDDDGRLLDANDAFLKMSGFTRNDIELHKATNEQLILPEWLQHNQQALNELRISGTITSYEKEVSRPDGSTWWGLFAGAKIDENENLEFVIDITTSKIAEGALRLSEASFRTLTDTLPQMIWTNDSKGKASYFNKRWYDYSGLTNEQSTGLGWETIVHPDDAQASKERWDTAFKEGRTFDTEYRLRRADGVYRWHIGRNTPLYNADGQVISWFGSATDVEDLKTAEENMRASQQRLQATMASACDYAIITTNTGGFIEAWNSGAEQTFGYTAAEVIGRSAAILFTPEDQATGAPAREMQRAREESRSADERWHQRKDGSRFYASGVMSPILNDGKLDGYVKVARDITERQQVEESLRIAEERYRTVLESADMATWDWNIPENKVIWNREHYLMLGADLERTQLDADYFLQFIHPEDLDRVRNSLFEAVTTKGTYHADFRIIRSDNGEIRWMSGFGRVAAVKDDQAVRMVGVMSDITERKFMEQQKDDFLGIASHELKTPVTSIKAYAQILQEMFQAADDPSSFLLMQKLDAQVDRLTSLIGNLLDTTKISEGQLPLHLETFDFNHLLTERTEDLQRLSPNHKLVLEPCGEAVITADRERIGQVLTNLVSNAFKYSPKGKEVTIRCRQEQDRIQVSVQDQGIGIPEEVQQRVFDRFFRVRDVQIQNFPGMGLGLYITGGIVHRHGGEIWLKSRVGEGSTFFFSIPVNNRLL